MEPAKLTPLHPISHAHHAEHNKSTACLITALVIALIATLTTTLMGVYYEPTQEWLFTPIYSDLQNWHILALTASIVISLLLGSLINIGGHQNGASEDESSAPVNLQQFPPSTQNEELTREELLKIIEDQTNEITQLKRRISELEAKRKI